MAGTPSNPPLLSHFRNHVSGLVLAGTLLALAGCGGSSNNEPAEFDSLPAEEKSIVLAAVEKGTFSDRLAAERPWLYQWYLRLLAQKPQSIDLVARECRKREELAQLTACMAEHRWELLH